MRLGVSHEAGRASARRSGASTRRATFTHEASAIGRPPQTSVRTARRGLRSPAAASSGQPSAAVEIHDGHAPQHRHHRAAARGRPAQLGGQQVGVRAEGAGPEHHRDPGRDRAARQEHARQRAVEDHQPAQARGPAPPPVGPQRGQRRREQQQDRGRLAHLVHVQPARRLAPEQQESRRGQQRRQPRAMRDERARQVRERSRQRERRQQLERGPDDRDGLDPRPERERGGRHREAGGGPGQRRLDGRRQPQRGRGAAQPAPARHLERGLVAGAGPPPEPGREQLDPERRREARGQDDEREAGRAQQPADGAGPGDAGGSGGAWLSHAGRGRRSPTPSRPW